jgi:hypothetical protein
MRRAETVKVKNRAMLRLGRRDITTRAFRKLTADQSLELNRIFIEYQKFFGEAQKLGKEILKRLAA